MASLKRIATALFWSVLIFGGFFYYLEHDKENKEVASQKREARREKLKNRTVKEDVYFTNNGVITVMDIPIKQPYASSLDETKRCIIYKESESPPVMSCENSTDPVLD